MLWRVHVVLATIHLLLLLGPAGSSSSTWLCGCVKCLVLVVVVCSVQQSLDPADNVPGSSCFATAAADLQLARLV